MMGNLVKQNFLILSPHTYLGVILAMLVAFIMALPASFIFVVSFFALIFSLYTYDNKNHVQRFIVSLPVSKKDIIRGRYIYSVCTVIFLLLILWVWMGLLSLSPLLTDSHYVYNWRDMVVMFAIGGLIISFSSPILYRLPFYFSSLIILISLGVGSFFYISAMMDILGRENADVIIFNDMDAGLSLLAEKYIPFLPYFILILGTFTLLYISMLICTRLVENKDM